jgi:beta-lactamase superfamily II metal-dependent hydrolase
VKIKLFLSSLVIIIFLIFQIPQFFNQKTLFVFCDVGEGDGALLITKENVFLIDAGRDSRMVDCLTRHLPFWRREITGAIITHPDADHINGLNSVIQSYRLKWMFSNFTPNKTGEFRKIYDALANSGVVVKSFEKGEKIRVNLSENSDNSENQKIGESDMSDNQKKKPFRISDFLINLIFRRSEFSEFSEISIESLWPLNSHHEYESTNLFSTVSVVTIGESKFLMLADSEIATQIELMPEIVNPKSEIRNPKQDVIASLAAAGRSNPLFLTKEKIAASSRLGGTPRNDNLGLGGKNKYLAVKIAHHGSAKNFSYTLLRETRPEYAIISVGKNNYGHPGKKAIDLISSLGIQILRTDQIGDVIFECEEKKCVLRE